MVSISMNLPVERPLSEGPALMSFCPSVIQCLNVVCVRSKSYLATGAFLQAGNMVEEVSSRPDEIFTILVRSGLGRF